MTIPERLQAVRKQMSQNQIDAFIVYSSDPHASEYLPSFWKERTWVSGFTGSAGFAVITADKAGVWTDGRYFVQAADELHNTGFTLFKEGVEGTPHYIDWLLSELKPQAKVAVNALCTSHSSWEALTKRLKIKNISVVDNPILKSVWSNRPADFGNPIFIQKLEYAGKSVTEKISEIRAEIKRQNATIHIVSSLDDVAWITNLRGSDVNFNPVFLSYLIITETQVKLFTDVSKCSLQVKNHLQENQISLFAYDDFFAELLNIHNEKVLISSNANQSIFQHLERKNEFIQAEPPSQLMKAQKNSTELEGFRIAMKKDAVALVNFLYWFENQVGKQEIDEYSLGRTLEKFRAEQPDFVGNSFNEIIGYQGNGAVIHYSAKKETAKSISAKDTILIDSGGQYHQGTTDITRVLVLGDYPNEFREDYTLVLKGMIGLSRAKFIKGTRGVQLDALARMPLWQQNRDYAHGTGHGVGSFLNVHEGPQNIRKDLRDIPLMLGMVCSNEPGLYRENKYGIRIENLIAVQKEEVSEFGEFYSFETLTLCPIDTRPILVELLTNEERQWLNDYHQRVKEVVSPLLEEPQRKWLENACKSI